MKQLLVYLIFNGECREALDFYAHCLNGKITTIQTFEESPLAIKNEFKDYIFDSELQAGEVILKASDSFPENKIVTGSNFSIFVTYTIERELRATYQKLQEGGKVIMELSEKEGEGRFCMVKDKFDIQWMLTLTT